MHQHLFLQKHHSWMAIQQRFICLLMQLLFSSIPSWKGSKFTDSGQMPCYFNFWKWYDVLFFASCAPFKLGTAAIYFILCQAGRILIGLFCLPLNMGVICSALMLGVRNEFLFGQFSFTKVVRVCFCVLGSFCGCDLKKISLKKYG